MATNRITYSFNKICFSSSKIVCLLLDKKVGTFTRMKNARLCMQNVLFFFYAAHISINILCMRALRENVGVIGCTPWIIRCTEIIFAK